MQNYTLDLSIYTTEAIQQGAVDYAKYLDVRIKRDSSVIVADVEVKSEYRPKAEQVVDEFLNYILDLSMKERLKTL